jgi:hypothetical protein
VKNAHLDPKRNWFLGGFNGHSRLESENTQNVPNEVYPDGASTIHISGPKTQALVWIKFTRGQRAMLDDMPNVSRPYTWSFGRNHPKKTNVGYEVDVRDAPVGINLQSESGSDVTVANNQWPIGIGYTVVGAAKPETVRGLNGSTKRISLEITNGRKMKIVNSLIAGWQFGANHCTAPVTLEDSTVNESIAGDGGTIHAVRCKFLDGGLGAFGTNAKLTVDDSDIRSFSVFSSKNGVLTVRDSTIHGSTIQAGDDSRIVLLNDRITTNANLFYGGKDAPAHFLADGRGSVVGLGVEAPNPVHSGDSLSFKGDAFVVSPVRSLTWRSKLWYRRVGERGTVPLTTFERPNVHGAVLGSIPAGRLTAGKYLVVLQLTLSDGTQYSVHQYFSVTS